MGRHRQETVCFLSDLPSLLPRMGKKRQWVKSGVFQESLLALTEELEDAGLLKLQEAFLDGCFVPAKRGAMRLGSRNEAKAAA